MNLDEKRLLSPKEAAEYLHMSADTLANWRSSGTGPKFNQPAKKVYYFKDDLDEWIKGGAEKA